MDERCGHVDFIGPHERKRDATDIWVVGAAILAMRIAPAPPIATLKMTGSPFHVLIGSIPMMRNSPIGWSKY